MADREPVEVTVEIDGRELTAGTLWVHDRGGQTASFRYADSYLTSPGSYALDPVLPKAAGVFHTPPGSALFSAFADSAPDRWGENLMRREADSSSGGVDLVGSLSVMLAISLGEHIHCSVLKRRPGWSRSNRIQPRPTHRQLTIRGRRTGRLIRSRGERLVVEHFFIARARLGVLR
jgi:hypothetical protein